MSSRRLAATTTATIQPSCELPANRRIITIPTAHSTDFVCYPCYFQSNWGFLIQAFGGPAGYNPNLAFVDLAGQTTLFHDPFHSGPPTTVPGTNHLVQVNPARETGLHEITLLTFDPTTRRLQRTEPNPFAEVNLIELFPSAAPSVDCLTGPDSAAWIWLSSLRGARSDRTFVAFRGAPVADADGAPRSHKFTHAGTMTLSVIADDGRWVWTRFGPGWVAVCTMIASPTRRNLVRVVRVPDAAVLWEGEGKCADAPGLPFLSGSRFVSGRAETPGCAAVTLEVVDLVAAAKDLREQKSAVSKKSAPAPAAWVAEIAAASDGSFVRGDVAALRDPLLVYYEGSAVGSVTCIDLWRRRTTLLQHDLVAAAPAADGGGGATHVTAATVVFEEDVGGGLWKVGAEQVTVELSDEVARAVGLRGT